jgi:glucokinase
MGAPENVPTAVAIDVGGTAMKCALVDATGAVLTTERYPTGVERGPDAVVAGIVEVAAELVSRSVEDARPASAVGLVVPGVVHEDTGVAAYASNLGWDNVPFVRLVEERTGLPTALGHDVRAGAVAEARLGAGRDSANVLFVAIGTGIAAGHVLDGRTAYPGAHGAPSELGHVVVRPGGRLCGCGEHGCLEAYTSASQVARRYAEAQAAAVAAATGEAVAGSAAATGTSAPVVPSSEVVALAETGDPVAVEVWRETVEILADGLTIAVRLLDPELIVLGGGLAEARDALLTPLAAGLEKRVRFQTVPRLRRAALGDEAGSIGAALLALDRLAPSDPPDRLSGRSDRLGEGG